MIAKWKAKAIIQKTISYFPKKEKINYLFQKYVTKGVYLTDEYFGFKITHVKDHLNYFAKYSLKDYTKSNILELGTGWYPIVPIAMYLSDFNEIISIDIQSWMTKQSQITTIEKFVEWRNEGKLTDFLFKINENRWNDLISILEKKDTITEKEINAIIRLKPSIQDARKTNFENESLDFICSNNTFEHIHKEVLEAILTEFFRVLKKHGMMCHFIDMSDHFAHFDKNISIYNFLQYTEKKWNRIDNDIQPQNRLRFKDYLEIYKSLNIPITDKEIRKGDVEKLKNLNLSPQYKNYTLEELAISHTYLISTKTKI